MDAVGHQVAHGHARQRAGANQAEAERVGGDERAGEGDTVANGLLDEAIGERRQHERQRDHGCERRETITEGHAAVDQQRPVPQIPGERDAADVAQRRMAEDYSRARLHAGIGVDQERGGQRWDGSDQARIGLAIGDGRTRCNQHGKAEVAKRTSDSVARLTQERLGGGEKCAAQQLPRARERIEECPDRRCVREIHTVGERCRP